MTKRIYVGVKKEIEKVDFSQYFPYGCMGCQKYTCEGCQVKAEIEFIQQVSNVAKNAKGSFEVRRFTY